VWKLISVGTAAFAGISITLFWAFALGSKFTEKARTKIFLRPWWKKDVSIGKRGKDDSMKYSQGVPGSKTIHSASRGSTGPLSVCPKVNGKEEGC
jgi:hypothetical protein